MVDCVTGLVRRHRLVAILRGVPADRIVEMGEALLEGGIRVMEVALSTPDALVALERLRLTMEDRAAVGAGTVVDAEQGRRALGAGAQFFVTPHVAEPVCELAARERIPVIAGALTPTEIARAVDLGAAFVKLFPAAAVGSEYIRALLGPYPKLEILAVGGVGITNLADFLRAGAVGAGIGGALTQAADGVLDPSRVQSVATRLVSVVKEEVKRIVSNSDTKT
ncbi:MAG: bifunctional 4-hydroxy-2-oxoglutarate aldolase/2-dehydro-3-deoxy-phosphogluconate aldolase [Firmicutes bacterium]|nr:bifunctional 4-hydroxy-2-oxoglutarate aldolase/2-dehydro-3-deoxy-phosphogluconate aldolase [Bacillota bacterium]